MNLIHNSRLTSINWLIIGLIIFSGTIINYAIAGSVTDQTTFYFVRHAEIDKQNADKPLNNKGIQRADALVEYMKQNHITHIYASHTDRTRDTVGHLAQLFI